MARTSRAKRCAEICSALTDISENVRGIYGENNDEEKAEKEAAEILADLDYSGLEELKDELESWKDNLPENLQSSNKASMLDDAISQLESAISALGNVNLEPDFDDIENVAQEIEDAVAEAESVEFPGMFS